MEPSYRHLKDLLLRMAEERSVEGLLRAITSGLAAEADVALARVWLLAPGDICEVCPRRDECSQHVPCLHLVASAGTSRSAGADWSRIDGDFRRIPLGVRKIGEVGLGRTVTVEEIEADERWIARPEWARREGIRGFGGAPMQIGDEEVVGVLAVFTRAAFGAETLEWLRILADHGARAIANARAFEEIARLRHELELENGYLREQVAEAKSFGQLVGSSAALRAIDERIDLVAPTDATVLIQGESGTGKELVASEIHRRSRRAEQAWIQVNCAAIPRELVESEFFGHVKGAFTGASQDREGRFAAAHGGTLFLDEVGELPLDVQGRLLRVLQEGRYERVGEERSRSADVRLVAATNRDLRAEVAAGRFREDLYYRLDVFPIDVPPLRERPADVEVLARHFAARLASKLRKPTPLLGPAAIRSLESYPWPGNVRELQNVIERALITWRGGPFRVDLGGAPVPGPGLEAGDLEAPILDREQWRALERRNLERALERCLGKVSGPGGAAELLGMNPNTLRSRLERLGLKAGTSFG